MQEIIERIRPDIDLAASHASVLRLYIRHLIELVLNAPAEGTQFGATLRSLFLDFAYEWVETMSRCMIGGLPDALNFLHALAHLVGASRGARRRSGADHRAAAAANTATVIGFCVKWITNAGLNAQLAGLCSGVLCAQVSALHDRHGRASEQSLGAIDRHVIRASAGAVSDVASLTTRGTAGSVCGDDVSAEDVDAGSHAAVPTGNGADEHAGGRGANEAHSPVRSTPMAVDAAPETAVPGAPCAPEPWHSLVPDEERELWARTIAQDARVMASVRPQPLSEAYAGRPGKRPKLSATTLLGRTMRSASAHVGLDDRQSDGTRACRLLAPLRCRTPARRR